MFPDELELADLLVIAEGILGIDTDRLLIVIKIPEAESALAAPFANYGGIYFYPHPTQRAAICCSRLIRNHPLPDGNKRIAYESMREMLERSGLSWPRPSEDVEEIVYMIEGLAAGTVSEPDFIRWAQSRTGHD